MDSGGQGGGRGTGMGGGVQGQMDESRWDSAGLRGWGARLSLSPTASPSPPPRCRFWFRLYWFPLKVLYATCHSSLRSVPDIPFYFFFNALLLLLTLMNLYWFLVSRQPTAPCPPSWRSPSSGPGAGPSQAHPGKGMFGPGNSTCKGPVAGAYGHREGSRVREVAFSHLCPLPHSTSWPLLPRC